MTRSSTSSAGAMVTGGLVENPPSIFVSGQAVRYKDAHTRVEIDAGWCADTHIGRSRVLPPEVMPKGPNHHVVEAVSIYVSSARNGRTNGVFNQAIGSQQLSRIGKCRQQYRIDHQRPSESIRVDGNHNLAAL